MTNTSVPYMGLRLNNPIIVSSSSLTGTPEGVIKAAEAGAGAVVLKSLFEEQVSAELEQGTQGGDEFSHPEANEYLSGLGMQLGPQGYLDLISRAKKETSIPIFASMNCVAPRWWGEYATQLSKSGADGVEINISYQPRTPTDTAASVEKYVLQILEKVTQNLTIPFSVKLGPFFSDFPHLATEIRKTGAKALVLFNRFYQFDVDIDTLKPTAGIQFSTPQDYNTSLRWISILYGMAGIDLSGSTGVHDGKTLIKMLLAGANTVQVCSAVYKHGYPLIGDMIKTLEDWMESKGYTNTDKMIGALSQEKSENPEQYERLQYIKALTKIH